MPKLTLLVGPPGSGKSTLTYSLMENEPATYINQDSQGPQYFDQFKDALSQGKDLIVDRLNFDKKQRDKFLAPAKEAGYEAHIIVLHTPYEWCIDRCKSRENHPTITNEDEAKQAVKMFFAKYERVTDDEADEVTRIWPEGIKPNAIWIDIDNTLANTDHRQHFMQGVKKDWKSFLELMSEDTVNEWCRALMEGMKSQANIVICTARDDFYKQITEEWLKKNNIHYDAMFMRHKGDYRRDAIVKEIIYEFELKPRYNLLFSVDDRKSVVDQMRTHGVTVLDCAGAKGHF